MNKKSIIATLLVACTLMTFGESLYIPLTSNEHLEQYNLKEGEIAYKKDGGDYTLLLGNGTKNPTYVGNKNCLITENILSTVDPVSIIIEKPADAVYLTDGSYCISNNLTNARSYSFTIKIQSGLTIANLAFDKAELDLDSSTTDIASYKMIFNENQVTLQVTVPKAYVVKLWNFVVMSKNSLETRVNDVTKDGCDFSIKDNGYTTEDGQYEPPGSTWKLGELREWVANLFNGNRGQHWANYNATNNVYLAGHSLLWNESKEDLISGFTYKKERFNIYNNGYRSYYVTETQQEIVDKNYSDAHIHITDIDANMQVVTNIMFITFEFSSFPEVPDYDKFCLVYCDSYAGNEWSFVKPLRYEIISGSGATAGTIKLTLAKSSVPGNLLDYWKVIYDSEMRQEVIDDETVWVRARPQTIYDATDVIFLNGAVFRSASGKYFKFGVTDEGQTSWEPYTLKVDL